MYSRRHKTINFHELFAINQSEPHIDSKLLSEFPFTGHGAPDNNLESTYIFPHVTLVTKLNKIHKLKLH
jgi:hypothetical protein